MKPRQVGHKAAGTGSLTRALLTTADYHQPVSPQPGGLSTRLGVETLEGAISHSTEVEETCSSKPCVNGLLHTEGRETTYPPLEPCDLYPWLTGFPNSHNANGSTPVESESACTHTHYSLCSVNRQPGGGNQDAVFSSQPTGRGPGYGGPHHGISITHHSADLFAQGKEGQHLLFRLPSSPPSSSFSGSMSSAWVIQSK